MQNLQCNIFQTLTWYKNIIHMYWSAKYYHYTKIPPFLFPQRIFVPQGILSETVEKYTSIYVAYLILLPFYCEIMYFVMMLTYITWLGCIWFHR